jgi:apolipoprotein N-acyltransferase
MFLSNSQAITVRKLLLVLLSGLLLTAGLPKLSQTYLLWGALLPFLVALQGQMSGRNAFVLGFAQGMSQNLSMLYWIVYVTHVYGKLPLVVGLGVLVLLAGYLSLFRGVWAWGFCWGEKRGFNPIWWGPVLWVTLEFGQVYIFTGFPWELLGYGLVPYRLLVQNADLTGVYGLSFLVVLVNMAIYQLLMAGVESRSRDLEEAMITLAPISERATYPQIGMRARLGGVVITLVIIIGAFWYGNYRLHDIQQQQAQSPGLKVAVIQGNIEQGQKWDPKFQGTTLNIYAELTQKVKKEEPKLIIWPETAAPFFFLRNKELSQRVEAVARKSQSYLLFGSPAFELGDKEGEERFYNRAYLLSPHGQVVGTYDKAHLVPYGEYVPLRRFFPFIGKMVPMVGDFVEGPPGAVQAFPDGVVGSLICFESIFPDLSRAMVQNGAQLLVNITNDAWFGTTSAPYQHLSMATLRAIENRVSLARAANTGFSAFVSPDGQTIWRSGLYEPAAQAETVPLLSSGSFYSRYGDVFAWCCLGLTALGLLGGIFLQRSPKVRPNIKKVKNEKR